MSAAKACQSWQKRQMGNIMLESTLGSAVSMVDVPGAGASVGNIASGAYNMVMDRKWQAETDAAERDCERATALAEAVTE